MPDVVSADADSERLETVEDTDRAAGSLPFVYPTMSKYTDMQDRRRQSGDAGSPVTKFSAHVQGPQ